VRQQERLQSGLEPSLSYPRFGFGPHSRPEMTAIGRRAFVSKEGLQGL
jgi:hypothetical protein